MAPKPSTDARPTEPIIVAGALRTASGLGISARLCFSALKASGLPVLAADLTGDLMQPADYPAFGEDDGRNFKGPATVIIHVNAPLMPLAMTALGRDFIKSKYVVGYWAWELPEVPHDWRFGPPLVQEIWVPSEFTATSIAPLAEGRALRVVPHPARIPRSSKRQTWVEANRPFTALLIFNAASSIARKNPFATIEAFLKAFGTDSGSRLIVKASHMQSAPEDMRKKLDAYRSHANIDVIDHIMEDVQLDELYERSDVLVSLHRSEGFGLTVAEGMARGLPVISTDWSGTTDFVSMKTGIPVPYRLIPAEDPQETYHFPHLKWADADTDFVAEALKSLRTQPELARQLGANAGELAARQWSASTYSDRIRSYLRI